MQDCGTMVLLGTSAVFPCHVTPVGRYRSGAARVPVFGDLVSEELLTGAVERRTIGAVSAKYAL
jgi:hypothetical protein